MKYSARRRSTGVLSLWHFPFSPNYTSRVPSPPLSPVHESLGENNVARNLYASETSPGEGETFTKQRGEREE